MEELHTSTSIARRLDVHPNTIRTWADTYSAFMSAEATSKARRFTAGDLHVLATIAHYRSMGLPLAEIDALLSQGKRLDYSAIPPEPTLDEARARAELELVPRDQLNRALDEVKRLYDEMAALEEQRDKAIEALDENRAKFDTDRAKWTVERQQVVADYTSQINRLERQIGRLEGQLDNRRPAEYWLRWIAALVVLAVVAVVVVVLILAAR